MPRVNAARSKRMELIVPDMSGEALLEEVESPEFLPGGAIVFREDARGRSCWSMPPGSMKAHSEPDFFAMKVLSFLCELQGRRRRKKLALPISVVFTKADQCETAFPTRPSLPRSTLPVCGNSASNGWPAFNFSRQAW